MLMHVPTSVWLTRLSETEGECPPSAMLYLSWYQCVLLEQSLQTPALFLKHVPKNLQTQSIECNNDFISATQYMWAHMHACTFTNYNFTVNIKAQCGFQAISVGERHTCTNAQQIFTGRYIYRVDNGKVMYEKKWHSMHVHIYTKHTYTHTHILSQMKILNFYSLFALKCMWLPINHIALPMILTSRHYDHREFQMRYLY